MNSHFILIQDIEKFPGKFLKRALGYDTAICDLNYMSSLIQVAPDLSPKLIGFLINTDFCH
jgi:hypothetical protein